MDFAALSGQIAHGLDVLVRLGIETYFVCWVVHYYIDRHILKKIFPINDRTPSLVDVIDMAIHRHASENWRPPGL
jgi:hypothetical protein